MNIEKKLTQIWIGPKPAPMAWLNTWKEKHPDWEYSIFTDEMLRARKWHNQHLINHYYNTRKWPGVSDLIRYELLYENGGFWPEADMVCLENTDELFTAPSDHAYSCYENEAGRHNFIQPIMACNPGNEFVKHIIDTLHKVQPHQLSPEPFRSTGNAFLANHVVEWKHKLTIWPSHYFIPLFYHGSATRYNGPDKVYADHKWGSTGHANSVSYDKAI
jgi:mannosyltransferase OCH1-like enzyme